jgi:probable F420-dependent oxidoreductase
MLFNEELCIKLMNVGIGLPQIGPSATRENVIQLAQSAESAGFDSLWVAERLLWPLNPQTLYPATPDGSLPIEYQRVFDPIDLLTFVAANTQKIALGTCVVDMLLHTPVILARRFATLDIFSQGRVIAGLGLGWSKDEFQASNIPFENKGQRAEEFIKALKSIWTGDDDDDVEFKGKFYNIPPSKIGPKPFQKPHIPIYLGGHTAKTFSRIVNFDANGWMGYVERPLELLADDIKQLKDKAKSANKDPN